MDAGLSLLFPLFLHLRTERAGTTTHRLLLVHTDHHSCQSHRGLADPVVRIVTFDDLADHPLRGNQEGASYPRTLPQPHHGMGKVVDHGLSLFLARRFISPSNRCIREPGCTHRMEHYATARPHERRPPPPISIQMFLFLSAFRLETGKVNSLLSSFSGCARCTCNTECVTAAAGSKLVLSPLPPIVSFESRQRRSFEGVIRRPRFQCPDRGICRRMVMRSCLSALLTRDCRGMF